jgi:hypothetical protein
MVLSAVGLVAIWGGFELRERARRMTTWPSVLGRVTASAVVAEGAFQTDGSTSYYPQIRYTYVVAGRGYAGQRRSLLNVGVEGVFRGGAQRIVERYPVGSDVLVFYDPANPSEAILERTDPVAGPTLLVAVGVMLVLAGPLWSWFVKQW